MEIWDVYCYNNGNLTTEYRAGAGTTDPWRVQNEDGKIPTEWNVDMPPMSGNYSVFGHF